MHISDATRLFNSLEKDKRDRIFDSAVEEFALHGFRNASMNRLVKAAGISKGSLFLYFRTKSDLFNGIVEIATEQVKDYLREVRQETRELDFFERMESLLWAGIRFIDRHPRLARIYFTLLQSGEAPIGRTAVPDLQRRGTAFLAELIRESIERGELRSDLDVNRCAFMINAMFERILCGYHTEHLAGGLGLYQAHNEELDRWVRSAVDFLRHGLAENHRVADNREDT